METFVAWIQDNHLPLLGTQIAIVMAVAVWILLRRIRAQETSLESGEPAEGDDRTVVLPEEDAAQMFETLTALQEELERYRKPQPAGAASTALEEVTPDLPEEAKPYWDEEGSESPVASAARAVTEEFDNHLVDESSVTERLERPETTERAEEVSAADRVLRTWLEDVERLARRARRDSL